MEKLLSGVLADLRSLPHNEQVAFFNEIRKGLLNQRGNDIETLTMQIEESQARVKQIHAGNDEIITMDMGMNLKARESENSCRY